MSSITTGKPPRVLVVGAGISGLTAAWGLLKAAHRNRSPIDLTVIDANDRVGGWIHSVRRGKGNYLFEKGPHSIRVTKGHATLEMIEELGLRPSLLPGPHLKRYVTLNGEMSAVPNLSLMMKLIPAVLWGSVVGGVKEDMTIADFIKRHTHSQVAATLADAFVAGIYAGVPEQLSFKSTFRDVYENVSGGRSLLGAQLFGKKTPSPSKPQWIGKATMYSFQEGLRSLPVALAKRVEELGGKIQLNTTLTSLHTNKANNSNPHVLVSTHSSSSSSSSSPSSPSSYDHVVCTLSAKSLGKILSTSSSLLGNETDQNTLQKEDYARWRHLGEKMSKIDHASLALASVAFPTQLLKKRGFGVLLPRGGAGLDGVLGVIFLSDCFPGQMGDSKSTRLTGIHLHHVIPIPRSVYRLTSRPLLLDEASLLNSLLLACSTQNMTGSDDGWCARPQPGHPLSSSIRRKSAGNASARAWDHSNTRVDRDQPSPQRYSTVQPGSRRVPRVNTDGV